MLLVNTSSGNAVKVSDNKKIIAALEKLYDTVDKCMFSGGGTHFDIASVCEGYDALAVCGGDGTFNSTINAVRDLNIELVYIPCGTLNDAAHTIKSIKDLDDLDERRIRQIDIGEFNQTLFSYVAATGTFTAIGFLPKTKYKKLFKRFIYYLYAFKEYRLHRIKAKIEANGRTLEDVYTLIMAVKSKYVFGCNFNKLYKHNSGNGHLLLIKTPTGLFKFIKLFFLFFRCFFIGFKKEVDTKNIKFLEFSTLTLDLENQTVFCLDGERALSKAHNLIKFHKKHSKIFIP